MKRRFDPRNLILIVVSTSISLLVLEVLLRIVFSTNQSFLVEESHDKPFLVENKFWKVWHYPSSETKHQKDCFSVTYTTNNLGMRGAEASILKEPDKTRIALLGDSFIEGFGSNDSSTIQSMLTEQLGEQYEVLNFGVSGGFGTIHELALYENFVTHFKPDYVFLFYLNYNDPYDNTKAINEGLISDELEFQYEIGSAEDVLAEISKNQQPEAFNPKLQGLYIFNLAQKGGRTLMSYLQSLVNMKADFQQGLTDVYSNDETETLKSGYKITEKSLHRLDSLITADSSKLILIQLPDPYQIDENWISWSSSKYDVSLNPLQPNTRIKNICKKLDVEYYSMFDNAISHIQENNLTFPYFSQDCDRHPSEYGHEYFAEELNKLIQKRF